MKKAIGFVVLDLLCWVGATVALVWYGHDVIGAIVGALGLIVMYREVRTVIGMKRMISMIQDNFDLVEMVSEMQRMSHRLRILWAVKETGSIDHSIVSHWIHNSFKQDVPLDLCIEIVDEVLPMLIDEGEIVDGHIADEVIGPLNEYIAMMTTDDICKSMMA